MSFRSQRRSLQKKSQYEVEKDSERRRCAILVESCLADAGLHFRDRPNYVGGVGFDHDDAETVIAAMLRLSALWSQCGVEIESVIADIECQNLHLPKRDIKLINADQASELSVKDNMLTMNNLLLAILRENEIQIGYWLDDLRDQKTCEGYVMAFCSTERFGLNGAALEYGWKRTPYQSKAKRGRQPKWDPDIWMPRFRDKQSKRNMTEKQFAACIGCSIEDLKLAFKAMRTLIKNKAGTDSARHCGIKKVKQ